MPSRAPQQADPHDVFAIESILAGRTDHAPPLAHDARDPAQGPIVATAPEIHVAPRLSPDAPGAPVPVVEPAFRAADVSHVVPEKIGSDEIKVDAPPKQPESKWGHRIFMTVLALCGAIGAAAWQHYGDQAKAMAAEWAPPFVMAVLSPTEKPAGAEQASAAAVQAPAADQPATADQAAAQPVAASEQVAAPVAAATEAAQLQTMAQDLAAMSKQVEELKATIAQLRTSQASAARELPKAPEARVAAAVPPAPRPATAPVRKPKPAAPAQAAYVQPPVAAPAPAQAQPAPPPPPQLADDGAPVIRPPMPLR